jgi:PadR family transcriptional regulator PadR
MPSKDLVAASSTPIVLAILARGESYGYEILKEVRDVSGGELEWTDGMLYPVLHRLERKGLIRSRWETPKSGRRRKYYRLLGRGKTELVAEKKRWIAVHGTLTRLWREARV